MPVNWSYQLIPENAIYAANVLTAAMRPEAPGLSFST
jgi:hypothetical protein